MWRSLQAKFLLCVIPLFILVSTAGLSWLTEYDIRRNLDNLAARVVTMLHMSRQLSIARVYSRTTCLHRGCSRPC